MKKEFICVKPRSEQAEEVFDSLMRRLHSCRVAWKRDGEVGLESISNLYTFKIFEAGDDHWEVIK